MAGIARRARQVVIVVCVAVGTLTRRHRVRSGQREAGTVVVERRVQPRGRVVALIAPLGEIRRDMVRVRRSLIVLQVAARARVGVEAVVIVHVAISALPRRHSVHSGQWEVGCVVVKRRVRPRRCVVTLGTGLGKTCGHVVRIRGALVVLQMATDASCAGQAEVVVDVAVGTLARRDRMSSGERKTCRAVIEVGIEPSVCAVAESAAS